MHFQKSPFPSTSPKSSSDFPRAFWRFINHELPELSLSLGRKLHGFFWLDGWILEVCNTRPWLGGRNTARHSAHGGWSRCLWDFYGDDTLYTHICMEKRAPSRDKPDNKMSSNQQPPIFSILPLFLFFSRVFIIRESWIFFPLEKDPRWSIIFPTNLLNSFQSYMRF